MEYTLIRSKRKTMSISVERDLSIVVRVPLRMPAAAAEGFVLQSADWIHRQRERMRGQAELVARFTYADGDRIPFAGGELILATGSGRRTTRNGDYLLLSGGDRPAALAAYLREQARVRTAMRLSHFAAMMEVTPTDVKITSATTRWGSCSGRNSINFSYRVACLPDALLDYIVVHELAHIREHNHSPQFWAVVAGILPDCAKRRAELREFQQRIPF